MFKEGNEVKWTENVQQTQQAGPLAPNYWVTTSGRPCWGSAPTTPPAGALRPAPSAAHGAPHMAGPAAPPLPLW
ncbi:hypothetical protein Scani_33410 [Streptomyces caniferus]|uniref:Uncharacterized protein n=1 Tax=Streptomyces caniferus TaxID=285557 RepID=A0A640S6H4_9ACTN|nr:hypothetical protein Scani_33410 [Streptomyces caniferus]